MNETCDQVTCERSVTSHTKSAVELTLLCVGLFLRVAVPGVSWCRLTRVSPYTVVSGCCSVPVRLKGGLPLEFVGVW
mgnify:CR=1 FL=1